MKLCNIFSPCFIIYRHFIIRFFLYSLLLIFQPILGGMAYNVPAVYDVWAGIKGLCAAKTARPNVPQ
jgi:hypothetical protein